MPRHVNPADDQPTATAPYNFVPLPESVFAVEDGTGISGEKMKPRWGAHDRYVPGTHSGWIDLEIKTLTPLFIRGAVARRENGELDVRDARLRPEPYTTVSGRPAIPGASLRGMVRTLVEILSFAKIQPVSESRPFFRDLSRSRIGREYGRHFVENLGTLEAGIDVANGEDVRRKANGYRARVRAGFVYAQGAQNRTIRECGLARIEGSRISSVFRADLLRGRGPMATPNWTIQHAQVWVRADEQPVDYLFAQQPRNGPRRRHPDLYLQFRRVHALSKTTEDGHLPGVLVITGGIRSKHLEFVFLRDEPGDTIQIPGAMWDRFHDEDQITQWQGNAFPRGKPMPGCRRVKGHLRDGDPVFFLIDEKAKSEDNPDGLVFLGRAGMFRLPYDLRPIDLVPEPIRNAPLDLAEAMFGRVGDGRKQDAQTDSAIKGRVFFADAVASDGGPNWLEEVIVPRILSAPKPTTFQHYLTQDGSQHDDRYHDQLKTYLAGDHTAIRGHKLYWHRWDDARGLELVKEEPAKHDELRKRLQKLRHTDQDDEDPKQYTIIQPVESKVNFTGRIRFENLSDLELGALLCALDLPDGCAHKIGMGKPLGLGSIRITPRLKVVDRVARYRSWQASGIREDATGEQFREAFSKAMLAHARASQETLIREASGLRQIARLDSLYRLLSWSDRPRPEATCYMALAEFRNRPVLPTPHGVIGAADPWDVAADDRPRPGRLPDQQREMRPDATRGQGRGFQAPMQEAPPRRMPRVAAPSGFKPVQKGQQRRGTLRRSGDDWVGVLEGDERDARISNPDKIPGDCQEGASAEFYVEEQSRRKGILCRLERMLPDA